MNLKKSEGKSQIFTPGGMWSYPPAPPLSKEKIVNKTEEFITVLYIIRVNSVCPPLTAHDLAEFVSSLNIFKKLQFFQNKLRYLPKNLRFLLKNAKNLQFLTDERIFSAPKPAVFGKKSAIFEEKYLVTLETC